MKIIRAPFCNSPETVVAIVPKRFAQIGIAAQKRRTAVAERGTGVASPDNALPQSWSQVAILGSEVSRFISRPVDFETRVPGSAIGVVALVEEVAQAGTSVSVLPKLVGFDGQRVDPEGGRGTSEVPL
ncbi:hypothetical protein [Mangrovibacterium lignilyticum]|uniref:hypothetical protein n=1 Tax=Mangrovibacterium lignilyticum TaxID=2668052 RepID=UPI0013D72EEB|nr:hypothetical protein [Mangrovibacterium lignilyticum]